MPRTKKPAAPATIGERIRAARLKAGWTQVELAQASGVGQGPISLLESGKVADPFVSTLRKLADALGVTMDSLVPPPS